MRVPFVGLGVNLFRRYYEGLLLQLVINKLFLFSSIQPRGILQGYVTKMNENIVSFETKHQTPRGAVPHASGKFHTNNFLQETCFKHNANGKPL